MRCCWILCASFNNAAGPFSIVQFVCSSVCLWLSIIVLAEKVPFPSNLSAACLFISSTEYNFLSVCRCVEELLWNRWLKVRHEWRFLLISHWWICQMWKKFSVKIQYLSLDIWGKSLPSWVSYGGLVGPFQNSSFFTSCAMWCAVDLIYFSVWVGWEKVLTPHSSVGLELPSSSPTAGKIYVHFWIHLTKIGYFL